MRSPPACPRGNCFRQQTKNSERRRGQARIQRKCAVRTGSNRSLQWRAQAHRLPAQLRASGYLCMMPRCGVDGALCGTNTPGTRHILEHCNGGFVGCAGIAGSAQVLRKREGGRVRGGERRECLTLWDPMQKRRGDLYRRGKGSYSKTVQAKAALRPGYHLVHVGPNKNHTAGSTKCIRQGPPPPLCL